jgi:polyisoprenyl-phosphate glycosyltransferase
MTTDPRHDSAPDALLSLIIPVYYNAENIPVTWHALLGALAQLPTGVEWEVVFVEDGSGDRSYDALLAVHASAPDRVRVVKLTRNFGQVAAILAGFRSAQGDACAVMSADLQDPPELLVEMVRRWREEGSKIVLATRTERGDGRFAAWASRLFYRSMRRYAVPNMPEGGFDYFLLDRQVVDLMNQIEERNTFLQGQILWTGFVPSIIPYRRRRRELGRSRWTLSRKLKYFADGFVTYTVAPLRLITVLGLGVSALSFGYALLIVVLKLVWSIPIEGWAPIMVSILGLSGVQLVMLGIIGEYLWRNYYETRRLPNFVIETVVERAAAPAARARDVALTAEARWNG